MAEVGVRHRPRLHGSSSVSLLQVPRVLAALLPFWWAGAVSGNLGQCAAQGDAGFGLSTQTAVLLLLLVAGVLFFSQLRAPLLEPQEPRYAEIAREMHADGHVLVPVLNDEAYLDKPPLLYWLVMASYSLCGVSDAAARARAGAGGRVDRAVYLLVGTAGTGRTCRVLWSAHALSVGTLHLPRTLVDDGQRPLPLRCRRLGAGLCSHSQGAFAARVSGCCRGRRVGWAC